jgi:hypothetical protein
MFTVFRQSMEHYLQLLVDEPGKLYASLLVGGKDQPLVG